MAINYTLIGCCKHTRTHCMCNAHCSSFKELNVIPFLLVHNSNNNECEYLRGIIATAADLQKT